MCNKSVVMVGHDGTSSEGGRKPGRCWSNKSSSQSGFLVRGIIVIFVGGCCGKPYLPAQSADKLNGGGSSWDYDDSVVSLRGFFLEVLCRFNGEYIVKCSIKIIVEFE